MRKLLLLGMVVGGLWLGGCDDSASTPVPTNPTAERVQGDLKRAGTELKDAAATAGAEIKPVLKRAGQDVRQGVNAAANKVADLTATQPAIRP